MAHKFEINKVHDVIIRGDSTIIQLEYCNHNDYCDFIVEIKNSNINIKDKFKPGTNVVTNCHECAYDERHEGDWIKIVKDGFFEETQKNGGQFPEPVSFKNDYDFEKQEWVIPEDEIGVVPYEGVC